MIPGIDVSHWQNTIDWANVNRSGVKFAFIRATEFADKSTTLNIDNQFRYNAEGAQHNGIHWGAVHFFRTHIDPVIQAKIFCETVGEFSSLPPVLDLEVVNLKGERLNQKARLFLEEVERIGGRKPIIYTNSGFWDGYMASEKKEQTDWASVYPLFLAHYTSLWPSFPYPWLGWDFWQHSDSGSIPGIKTNVKLNWFNGSEKELLQGFIQKNAIQKSIDIDGDFAPLQTHNLENTVSVNNNKGDYQEAYQYPRGQQPNNLSENAAEAKYSGQEENWIRSYFF